MKALTFVVSVIFIVGWFLWVVGEVILFLTD
jgi:hypothetical protein